MKIIIDGRSISNKTSGISRYCYELIKGYVKQYGFHNVKVILKESLDSFEYDYIVCKFNRYTLFGTLQFSFFLNKLKYDIYHSGDMTGVFWGKKESKHISTVHDLMFAAISNFYGRKSIRNFLRIKKNLVLTYFILRVCDQIISVSKKTNIDLKKILGYHSTILREGVNKIENKPGEVSENINVIKSNSYFLYVGLAYPHKNIDFMIDSFANSRTDKKLIICGKNHKIQKVKNVEYLGFVSDAELNYLYNNCAAFIFPSLYEGFGLPILEALSFGSKVFSSNRGSLSEFSPEFVNYFNPYKHDELIKLIENVDHINLDISKVKTYLENFNWTLIWSEYHKNSN